MAPIGDAAAAVLARHRRVSAPAPDLAVGASYSPAQLGWEVPGARRLRLSSREGGGLRFEVEGSSRAARVLLADGVLDGPKTSVLLRFLDADGRLLRWEAVGKEGAEGEFDEKGALAVGRAWRGEDQTVTLRAADEGGHPELQFHKYRRGRKVGMRIVTLDRATLKATRIRDFDALGQLVRIATLGEHGLAEVVEPPRRLAFEPPSAPKPAPRAPPARPAPRRPPPARPAQPKQPPAKAPPPARPAPRSPATAKPPVAAPAPRALAAPPGTLLSAAPDGAFATAAAVVRRFGPAVGQARRLRVAGGAETWLVRREAEGRPLTRDEVANELLMREVLRFFYSELFESPPAIGFESGSRAALIERLPEGSTVQHTFRPFAPKERAALATLKLVFGLADLGPEHFVWREGRKPQLVGLANVRRQPEKPVEDERPLILVELRLGRVPFLRMSPLLPREDYEEEARRVEMILRAPGIGERLRERLARAGLTPEQAKGYWDTVQANHARFGERLQPYLDAASELEDLTDAGR